jgi:hypothetical protein
MEPVFMILGQSVGTAAALAIDGQQTVQDVPYARLKELLLEQGPESRVGKRCQGGAFLSYAAVVRIGAVHCAGFLFMVNEKPETSGFSLVFIRPAGGSPAGEIFC